MEQSIGPLARLWLLVREEKTDITAIYFFAALGGLIQLSVPLGIQAIIGFVLGGLLSASLVVLIAIVVIAVLFTGIMQVKQMQLTEKIQQKIFVRYAFAFARTIPKLDLKQVDGYYLPELVNRFFDTISLQKSISKLLLDIPAASIQILLGLVLLSFYHPVFILFGVLLLLLLWLILKYSGHKGLESSLAESTYKYSVAGWLEDMARLVKSFKFSAASELHLKKADEKTTYYLDARTTHFKILLIQYKTLIAFKVAITAAMLIVGVVLVLDQQINIGQFIAAEIVILTVINAVEKIIINLDSVYDVLTAVEKISKLTDKPVETSGTYKLQHNGAIGVQAQNLSFCYEAGKPVFENLSFNIRPGDKVCITGNDGSGKSTLLKLLAGIYTNFTGGILLNDIPLGNHDLTTLREQTGILFTTENVFHGSLLENITMGKPGLDLGYITALCQNTGLHSFISKLPNGFDTELDPAGKRLPKNVIQKIMLVRALAHKPSLVIIEEPWQGIEEQYKLDIQQLLLQLKNTTVIMAINDKAFNAKCDSIIELHKQ